MDQWLETGRQFVDGVAGNRPGLRTKGRKRQSTNNANLDSVGRWVGDKIDWLLEEEDDWLEPWQEKNVCITDGKKQPLEAISRRTKQTNSKQPNNSENRNNLKDQWPDEETFKIDRWKRQSSTNMQDEFSSKTNGLSNAKQRRTLPKSNRRRK